MPDYRRNRVPGGTFFFTVNLFLTGGRTCPHLEGLFHAFAWYDGLTSTAMVKEI